MILQSPGDVLIEICGFPIYYYGVIMAFACLAGVFVSYKIFKHVNPNLNYAKIFDFAAYILIIGFVCARLYYCLLNLPYYLSSPLEVLNFREGGLSIHGGLIGGVCALIILAKKYKLPILRLLDAFSCGTILAQSIGRWGNFFNSEAFGYPTDLPWKLFIPISKRPEMFSNFEYFHPAFLYESIFDLIVFCILLWIMKKYAKKEPGITFYSYIILYSCVRLLVESIRIDSALNIHGIPVAKIISAILIIIGIIGIVTIIKKNPETI